MSTVETRETRRSMAPAHPDPQERARLAEASRRYAILAEDWRSIVEEALRDRFAPEVADNLRADCPDDGLNPLKFFAHELAVLYHTAPTVQALDADPDALDAITPPRLWAQLGQLNAQTNAIKESLLRIDFIGGKVSWRVVRPDRVWQLMANPDNPTQPAYVEELRWRDDVDVEGGCWTWEIWDLRPTFAEPPQPPVFRIEREETRKTGRTTTETSRVDITEIAAPGITTGEWPLMRLDGRPILPYVLYHDRVGSRLWGWQAGMEMVNGTIETACKMTHWGHGFREASFNELHGIDVEPVGGEIDTASGRPVHRLVRDPTSIALWRRKNPAGGLTAVTHRYDTLTNLQAIMAQVSLLARFAHLSSGDVQASTTPESGVALTIRQEGKRAEQRRQMVPYAESDALTLSVSAALDNAYRTGQALLPEDPDAWHIQYAPLPKTPQEINADRERAVQMREDGVASDVDVLRVYNPGMSRQQAIEALANVPLDRVAIEKRRAELAAEMGVPPELLAPPKDPPPMGFFAGALDAVTRKNEGRISPGEARRFVQVAFGVNEDEAMAFVEDERTVPTEEQGETP